MHLAYMKRVSRGSGQWTRCEWVLGQHSAVFDFAEAAAGDVIDEAADGHCLGNPWMRMKFLQLVADIFFDVLEGIEKSRCNRGCSGTILDSGTQILFGGLHQSAIGVIDDHELFRAEQMMRHDQGTQGVVRYDAAGVSDDVGVSLLQSQSASRKPGIHTSQ